MSNEVSIFSQNIPAHIKRGRTSELLEAISGSIGGKRLSIKGGVFRLNVGGKEVANMPDRQLNVVLVKAQKDVGRTFYAGRYVEGEVIAPTCWSADGLKPDSAVKEKQANSCATCHNNVKGSGQNDTKACKYSKRLAVVLENDMGGDVLQLSIPAQSIWAAEEGGKHGLQSYGRMLGANGVAPEQVVTELSFDLKSPVPKLWFKAVRFLAEQEQEIVDAQQASDDAKRAVTFTVAQTDGAVEAEAPPAPRQLPRAEPVETEEVEAEAEKPRRGRPPKAVEEPTVRASAKAPDVGSKPSIENLVSEWDDA